MQQMKVIFAAEMLAADINMPTRTTVVSFITKQGDTGSMELCKTAILLQMTGRAGMRGMDTDGTCDKVEKPLKGHEERSSQLHHSSVYPILL
eukprot:15365533-Ditylum_brightwellii.AAC.2